MAGKAVILRLEVGLRANMNKHSRVAIATLVLLLALGCSGDPARSGDVVFQPYWTPLFLAGNSFSDLEIAGGSLYVAERTKGVYVQSPAFSGSWSHLGLEVGELSDPYRSYGITSLALVDDFLVAGLNLPAGDARPRLYRLRLGDSEWRTGSFDPGNQVRDLITLPSGNIVGLDRDGTFSSNDGQSWTRSETELIGLEIGRLFVGPDALYCGGHGPTREPRLYRSLNGGATWDLINLGRSLAKRVGTIYAIAGYQATEPALFFTVDADVYRSDNGGGSFYHLLEIPRTPGQIHLNPRDSQEIIVIGGYVYWSRDGGIDWDVFALPRGLPARRSVVDWDNRKMAVTTSDGLVEAIYAFDLVDAEPFLDD